MTFSFRVRVKHGNGTPVRRKWVSVIFLNHGDRSVGSSSAMTNSQGIAAFKEVFAHMPGLPVKTKFSLDNFESTCEGGPYFVAEGSSLVIAI
jgi:hypothetical protein